jgi:hypothetical protein
MQVDTTRYEREHGRKPTGRRFWRFILVSDTITAKDHYLDANKAETYDVALKRAIEVAELRRAARVEVEP